MNRFKTVVAGCVAGVLLLAVAAWFIVLSPRTGKASTIDAQTASVQETTATLQTKLVALNTQKAGIGAEEMKAAALQLQAPPTADLAKLIGQIDTDATAAGIPADQVSSLTPGVPAAMAATSTVQSSGAAGLPNATKTGQVATMALSLSVKATFAQVHGFLHNLEAGPRAFVVGSVALSPTAGTYTVSLTGTLFVLPPITVPTG